MTSSQRQTGREARGARKRHERARERERERQRESARGVGKAPAETALRERARTGHHEHQVRAGGRRAGGGASHLQQRCCHRGGDEETVHTTRGSAADTTAAVLRSPAPVAQLAGKVPPLGSVRCRWHACASRVRGRVYRSQRWGLSHGRWCVGTWNQLTCDSAAGR